MKLFDTDHHGVHAYDPPSQPTETSRQAAENIKPISGRLQKAVLAAISGSDQAGMTDPELQAALSMKGSTERPRRRELYLAGLIRCQKDPFGTPVTREGCQVWVKR